MQGATQGQRFLSKAQELIQKFSHNDEVQMSPEEIKQSREQQSSLFFQQYLAAESNQDYEKALEYIGKQSEIIKLMQPGKSTKLCSNYYLRSKLQMKLCKFEDALASINDAFKLRDELADEFADDMPIVSARYFMQLADLSFVTRKYEECVEAA